MVLLTTADLAMMMPSTTWNLLDFRVAEKEKLLKQYLFAQPWWSRLWSAFPAIRRISKVIINSRKLIRQSVLHGPYDILGTWYMSTRYYCCVRVLYFKAPPFAASSSYWSFLSAGLGSSPSYSSLTSVQSVTFAVYSIIVVRILGTLHGNACSIIITTFFSWKPWNTFHES